MKVTKVKKLMMAGISVVTNNEIEKNEDEAKIPKLWEEYFEKNIYGKTFNKSNKDYMYGVYSEYEDENKGEYKVTIAVEVTKPKNAIVIEDKRYLVFNKKGELPFIVSELWEEIWDYFENNSEYERDYLIDFEKYAKEDEVEIYISIK